MTAWQSSGPGWSSAKLVKVTPSSTSRPVAFFTISSNDDTARMMSRSECRNAVQRRPSYCFASIISNTAAHLTSSSSVGTSFSNWDTTKARETQAIPCCSREGHLDSRPLGEMAERLNAPVLKTGVPVRVPRVRIPLSPLICFAQALSLPLKTLIAYRSYVEGRIRVGVLNETQVLSIAVSRLGQIWTSGWASSFTRCTGEIVRPRGTHHGSLGLRSIFDRKR